jgi:hypothetical protein
MSPRLVASLANISTDYTPCDPGVARFEITGVEAQETEGRVTYIVSQKIVEYVEDGNPDHVGRSVTNRISAHKKDGTLNEIGLSQIKRYFEVTVGDDRANADDADTDELIGQQFIGQLEIRSYMTLDKLSGEQQERQTNEITRFAAL